MSAPSPQISALSDEADPHADLRRAVRRRFGSRARIDNIVAPTLGGSNRTIVFDLIEAAATRRLVSRQETYTGDDNPFLSPADQFGIMRTVHRHGLPVPEPVFEYDDADGMGAGFVTGFVAGETMPKRIIGDPAFAGARSRLAGQLAEFLAGLNQIPLAEVAVLERISDSADPVTAQLRRYEAYAEIHPAIELGFRWLERNRPSPEARVLVHGDFRNGNFMVGPDGWSRCWIGNAVISAAGRRISAGCRPGRGGSARTTCRSAASATGFAPSRLRKRGWRTDRAGMRPLLGGVRAVALGDHQYDAGARPRVRRPPQRGFRRLRPVTPA